MATRYIALLRGINVGGHTVKMERLRSLFEELKLQQVASYINSGNIFFTSDTSDRSKITAAIEEHLEQALGYHVSVFLRTTGELTDLLASDPFRDITLTEDLRFCVMFTKQELDTATPLPVSSSKQDMEIVGLHAHEAFVVWHIIGGRPPSGKFPADILPADNTTRFYHTLQKILQASTK